MKKAFLQDARAVFEKGSDWSGLAGDALAFAIAEAQGEDPWLIVTDEPDEAERLAQALRFFCREGQRVRLFPADDSRPYDGFSPSWRRGALRAAAVRAVLRGDRVLVVAPARALALRIPCADAMEQAIVHLKVGQVFERDDLVNQLLQRGYLATAKVEQEGAIAVRGDVVDVWPALSKKPIRIDFFDDEVESLRRLDLSRPAASKSVKSIRIPPVREVSLNESSAARMSTCLSLEVEAQGRGVRLRRRLIEDVREGIWFSGVEDYLPALVETISPLELFQGVQCVVVSPDDVEAVLREFERSAAQRWSELEDDERPLIRPQSRYVPAASNLELLKNSLSVFAFAAGDRAVHFESETVDSLTVRGADLAPIATKLIRLASDEMRMALVAESEKRASALTDLFAVHGVELVRTASPWSLPRGRVGLLVGRLPRGFVAPDSGWAFLPSSALFGRKQRRSGWDRTNAFFDTSVSSMSQLKEGDYVVHRRHGIGQYQGMKRISVGEGEQDFVSVLYQKGDQLLLPVTRLDQLSRYQASNSNATIRLDRLGGQTWERRTQKVRDSLFKMANELLRLYAKRELAKRVSFEELGEHYHAFEASFPYQETPDQMAAIDAVNADLGNEQPMDRLLCGDVGFGKTEVAMRAAMRVVEGRKQVAVLCPTTVLAYQHYQTFKQRFENFPVNIGMLSRFNSTAQTKAVTEGLAQGKVDIVVGTTSLLGRSIRYADLGLLVVDEEHRFGVRQKERLKRLRANVDVLSMSATPIPRTLQMALGGLRDMSVMATPPQDRLAVRTTVARLSETRVRDSILQEIERGGQVFFIHNRVETIERMTERLQGWVPTVRFAFAHGQMDADQLERVLVRFVQGDVQVLVCTSIVENGVDIPNVNTILVDRADQFGLSQLYQLRGRVGRSSVRARCVLFTPEEITRDARKRLRVLVENTQLGAGFQVASADLEIRGGGNLLGEAQSGNIDAVGFETWVDLLGEAVANARGERERSEIDPDLNVQVSAFIPDDFVRDEQERLTWYRRFARLTSVQEVENLLDHFESEFGEAPVEVRNLAGMVQLRIDCVTMGIVKLNWLRVRAILELHPTSNRDAFESIIREYPKRFRWTSVDRNALELRFTPREAQRPFHYLKWVFAQLKRA